jgi:hypothetical protein
VLVLDIAAMLDYNNYWYTDRARKVEVVLSLIQRMEDELAFVLYLLGELTTIIDGSNDHFGQRVDLLLARLYSFRSLGKGNLRQAPGKAV